MLSAKDTRKLNAIFPDLEKMVVDIGPPMAVANYMDIYSEILKTVLADDTFDVSSISSGQAHLRGS